MLATAIALGLLSGTFPDSPKADTLPGGALRVGVAVESPYVFFDERRQLSGLEIEVVKHVAEKLGVKRIDWQQTDFNLLIPELNAGRFDMIAAGLFITPKRARSVSFSEPTFHVGQTLMVRAGNPRQLHAYEDIKREPTLKVAVLYASVEADLLREIGVSDSQLVVVPDPATGRAAVETGLADCLALSAPTVRQIVEKQQSGLLEMARPFTQPSLPGGAYRGFGAMAFRDGDQGLRETWNRQLASFIGGAEHRALLSRFGFNDEELPAGVSTAQILSALGHD